MEEIGAWEQRALQSLTWDGRIALKPANILYSKISHQNQECGNFGGFHQWKKSAQLSRFFPIWKSRNSYGFGFPAVDI